MAFQCTVLHILLFLFRSKALNAFLTASQMYCKKYFVQWHKTQVRKINSL